MRLCKALQFRASLQCEIHSLYLASEKAREACSNTRKEAHKHHIKGQGAYEQKKYHKGRCRCRVENQPDCVERVHSAAVRSSTPFHSTWCRLRCHPEHDTRLHTKGVQSRTHTQVVKMKKKQRERERERERAQGTHNKHSRHANSRSRKGRDQERC
jgi:hypothetical protein